MGPARVGGSVLLLGCRVAVEHGGQLVGPIRRPIEDAPVQVNEDGHDLRVELDAGELLELVDGLLVGERSLAVRA